MMKLKIVGMWYDHPEATMKIQLRNMDAPHGVNPYHIFSAAEFMKRLQASPIGPIRFENINMSMGFLTYDLDARIIYVEGEDGQVAEDANKGAKAAKVAEAVVEWKEKIQSILALPDPASSLVYQLALHIVNRIGEARMIGVCEGDPGSAPIMKGVAKYSGDGFKDPAKAGDVIFVYNQELPEPYERGQYYRVGHPTWSASSNQYDFTPMSLEDMSAFVEYIKKTKEE